MAAGATELTDDDEVVVLIRLQPLDRHEAMIWQLDDQGLTGIEALIQRPPRVRLQSAQRNQLDAHRTPLH
jgi:hypothetical protein